LRIQHSEKGGDFVTSIGFRVLKDIQRLDVRTVAGFLEARPPTLNVTDVMGRFGAVGQGIHPINGDDVYMVERRSR
jgi:hypothetical protein